MPIGICKYCGQERELIKSHIIPKSLYQFGKLGGVVGINAKEHKLDKDPAFQNGINMPLLCKDCDNMLGKLDGYINRVLNGAVPKIQECEYIDGSKCWKLPADKFDIPKIRKFFISLIWRFSVIDIRPFPLGKFSDIALKILKGEQPDNEKPLINKLKSIKNDMEKCKRKINQKETKLDQLKRRSKYFDGELEGVEKMKTERKLM